MRRFAKHSMLPVAAVCSGADWARQAASSRSDFKHNGAVLADMAASCFVDALPQAATHGG